MSGHRKFRLLHNGTLVSTRDQVNLIDGSNVTLTVADDSTDDRANVTIAASGGSGSGIGALVALSADATAITAQTTLQDVGLDFNIGASSTEIWFFEAMLLINSSDNTEDLKLGFASSPSGATASWGLGYVAGAAFPGFSAVATSSNPQQVSGISQTQSVGSANNGTAMYAMSGWVYGGGTSGAIEIGVAQATSDAGSLTVKKGSWVRYTKLAS